MCSIEYGALNCSNTDLSMGSSFSQANSISIDINNNSVAYIAGLYEDPNTAGNYIPCLWKNGDALEKTDLDTPIDFSSFNYISSMFIESDTINISGIYYYDNGNNYGYSPVNWSCKSDNCSFSTYLQSSDFDYYIPTSIISQAGNVYVSLTRNNNDSYQAYYWDENNSNNISNEGKATDIKYTENQNLYIVGQYVDANDPSLSPPAYWRGDPLEVVKLSVDDNGLATSLHVITDNEGNEYLYIGGYIEDTATAGSYKAVYWKVDVSENYYTEMYEIFDFQGYNINVIDMYFDSTYFVKPVSIFVEQD
jgi:hypothetical protein